MLGLVVMATVVVTGAVVREGMIVVGSKVLGTSGEWKETKYKIKSYHANKRETQMLQIINAHILFRHNLLKVKQSNRNTTNCNTQVPSFFFHFFFFAPQKKRTPGAGFENK